MDKNYQYLFSAPAVVFLLVMVAFPIIYTFILSFHSWRMSTHIPWKWVGLENYTDMFSDKRFLKAVGRTFHFTVIALTIEVFLGMVIALFLDRPFKGKNLTKTLFLLPMVATPVAVGVVWKLIYEPNIGIINYILRLLNLKGLDWLGDGDLALYALMVVDIWQWTPMVMLILQAGLSSIPTDCYEAARVDGATSFQVIQKITLPLLKPTIFTAVLLRLVDALKTFDIIYSMTMGGPGHDTETMNILSYKTAFEYMQFGEASAMLIVFFLIVLGLAAITIKIKSKMEVDTE